MFIAIESEEVCSMLFQTKEKEYLSNQKNVFSSDIIETDDKILNMKFFIGSIDSFCAWRKNIFLCFIENMFLRIQPKPKKWKKQQICMIICLKMMRKQKK